MRARLSWAIDRLGVLNNGNCTRKEALKAWAEVFNTSFFDDELKESALNQAPYVIARGEPKSPVQKGMADEPSVLAGYRQQKLREAEEYLASLSGFNAFTENELAVYKNLPYRPALGRSFKRTISKRTIELHLILDERFPFSKPRFYVVDKSLFLQIPHINEDGFICVSPDNASFSTFRTTDLIAHELAEAEAVCAEGLSGANKDDFVKEFLSYWDGLVRPITEGFITA